MEKQSRNKEAIGFVSALAVFAILVSLIPVSRPQTTHATDVSNDQPPIFITQSNSSNNQIPCSYLISTNGTYYKAQNCKNNHIDFKSSDASTVINQAINSTTNSQMIFLNQGDYIINHTSIELQHGTNIWGVSSGQSVTNGKVGTHIQLANNANINLMEYTKNNLGYFIHLNNLFLDGNYLNNAKGNGTYFNANASDVEIENTYMDGFKQNCVVADNVFNDRFLGSTFEHCQKDGMLIKKGTDMIVQASKFLSNQQYGLEIGTTNNGVAGAMIEGSYFASNAQFNMVTFNSPEMVIVGNFFQEVSNLPPSTGDHLAIENACSNTVVSSNSFIGSGHTRRAISITHASCNSAQIVDNNFAGTYSGATILDSGTSTMIRNNVGFKTENSGSATITSLATSIVVSHGLAYTPTISDIYLTPQGNSNSCTSWWVSTVTSTQFTINCNAAPTASSLTFSWSIKRT